MGRSCVIIEWEVWAIATKLMKDHPGIAAEEAAFERGKALQSAGDEEGYQTWLRVLGKIVEMNLAASHATRQ